MTLEQIQKLRGLIDRWRDINTAAYIEPEYHWGRDQCADELEEILPDLTAPSVWSSEKPTGEGFYPWTNESTKETVVQITRSFGDLWVTYPGTPHGCMLGSLDGEFGPKISMPSDPTEKP